MVFPHHHKILPVFFLPSSTFSKEQYFRKKIWNSHWKFSFTVVDFLGQSTIKKNTEGNNQKTKNSLPGRSPVARRLMKKKCSAWQQSRRFPPPLRSSLGRSGWIFSFFYTYYSLFCVLIPFFCVLISLFCVLISFFRFFFTFGTISNWQRFFQTVGSAQTAV